LVAINHGPAAAVNAAAEGGGDGRRAGKPECPAGLSVTSTVTLQSLGSTYVMKDHKECAAMLAK
jgi:hypothetical protein